MLNLSTISDSNHNNVVTLCSTMNCDFRSEVFFLDDPATYIAVNPYLKPFEAVVARLKTEDSNSQRGTSVLQYLT